MFCPQCGVEYRQGYTSCSDCHVFLVHERPHSLEQESLSEPGDPNKDPFCSFWMGTDQRVLAELCTVLDEEQIPYKTARRGDRLFNRMDQPRLLLGVPASLYERAEQVVGDAFSVQPLLRDTGGFVPESLETKLDFDEVEPAMELSDAPLESVAANKEQSELLGEWYPEDATAEVWSGESPELREMLEMSLRENEIQTRWESGGDKQALFVLPQDESRAREIVREVVEASPPE